MTSGPWTLMNATRSSVPFWISASRAVTVSKPSFSRAERMASITSSRELKIATRGDVRGVTAVVLSPLHAGHAQRVRASRGPDAAREEQGEEVTRAAALRESRPCTREAQPHCTSRRASRCSSRRAIDRPASTAHRQRSAVYEETEATAAALRSRALARLDRRLLHPFY